MMLKATRFHGTALALPTAIRRPHIQARVKASGTENPGRSMNVKFEGPGSSGAASHIDTTTNQPTAPLPLIARLRQLGLAGLVSYGICNTLYYTFAFTFVWVYVAKVPSGRGLAAAAASCAQVLGITWVGSQATKALRAGGALLMAPLVDRFLEFVRAKTGLRDKRQAFLRVILPNCIAFAVGLFGTMIIAWA